MPSAKQVAMVWAYAVKKTMIRWRNVWSMKWRVPYQGRPKRTWREVVQNEVTKCWCGYLSGSRCKWFAHGPADATATHHILLH